MNLNGKMLLVELALLMFLVVNVLSVAGINGYHEYINIPTILYMTVFTVAILIFSENEKQIGNGIRIAFSRKSNGISRMELEKAITAMKFIKNQTVYFKLRALGLTDREAEVARLVSCEMTNKEIGQMLYISDTTVKKHITHILEKTQLEDREKLTGMIKGL
ncbi:MAG: response regulator transcription factor [Acetatifactor sp.]